MLAQDHPRFERYIRPLTILFCVSLFFLSLHVIDDGLTTGEPQEYGVSLAEFYFYAGLIYLLLPPLGLILARRGRRLGLIFVLLYGFQALYGAGVNHLRHLFGNFSGSGLLSSFLNLAGIHLTEPRGQGMVSVLLGMAGLGQTPPHTHTLLSTLVVFLDTGINIVLIGVALLALAESWRVHEYLDLMPRADDNV
jgi:hypothetical protein